VKRQRLTFRFEQHAVLCSQTSGMSILGNGRVLNVNQRLFKPAGRIFFAVHGIFEVDGLQFIGWYT